MMSVLVRVGATLAACAAVLGALMLPRMEAAVPVPAEFDVLGQIAPAACPGPLTVPVGDVDSGDPDIAPQAPTTELRIEGAGDSTELDGAGGTAFAGGLGALAERVPRGDIAGLAMMTCTQPATDQWLVGGSTAIGSSARLVLSNPSRAAVDVEVSVYGPVGQVDQRVITVVAPGHQEVVLLEAVEVSLSALVVRVESTGVGVVAALQDSRLDGLQPAGTDWVTPSALGESLVIPVASHPGDPSQVQTTVRVMAPEGGIVSLGIVTPTGLESWGGVQRLVLDPGVVVDVAVPHHVAAAIEVRADVPVVAAAYTRVQREATEGLEGDIAHDHRWVGAEATERRERSAVVLRARPQLWMYFPVAADVEVTDADGTVLTTLSQGARRLTVVDLDVPVGTVIRTDARVSWALVHSEAPGYLSAVLPVTYGPQQVVVTVVDSPYLGR